MNEQEPIKKSISLEELERMKKRWLELNAAYDGKCFGLFNDPTKRLSPEEHKALKADQKELADLENRLLDSVRQ